MLSPSWASPRSPWPPPCCCHWPCRRPAGRWWSRAGSSCRPVIGAPAHLSSCRIPGNKELFSMKWGFFLSHSCSFFKLFLMDSKYHVCIESIDSEDVKLRLMKTRRVFMPTASWCFNSSIFLSHSCSFFLVLFNEQPGITYALSL